MPNTRVPIGHIFGGISKQPPSQRFTNQVADSRNTVHRINDGTSKRAGTEVIRTVDGFIAAEDFRIHTINRDDIEKYLVVYGDGLLRVFQAQDGTECAIDVEDAAADYLAANGAGANDQVLVTQSDTTLIANKTVAMQTTPSENFSFSTVADWDAIPDAPGAPVEYFFAEAASTSGRPGGYYKRVVAEDRFITCQGASLFSSERDGTQNWTAILPGPINAIDYDSEFNVIVAFTEAGIATNRVRKFDPDGAVLWTYDQPGNAVVVGANDVRVDRDTDDIYVAGDVNGDTDTQYGTRGQLYALDKDGNPKWGTIAGDPIPFGLVDVAGGFSMRSITFVGGSLIVVGQNDGIGANAQLVGWKYNKVSGALEGTFSDSRADSNWQGFGLSIAEFGTVYTFCGTNSAITDTLLLQQNITTSTEMDSRTLSGQIGTKCRVADESLFPSAVSYIMLPSLASLNMFNWTGTDLAGGVFSAPGNDGDATTDINFVGNEIWLAKADAADEVRIFPLSDPFGAQVTTVNVTGTSGATQFSGFFFEAEPGTDSKNLVRVPPPNEPDAFLNNTTMPVQLTRLSINPCSFRLSLIDWVPNLSGTSDVFSTPAIFTGGATIADLTLFRGRFWLLSDDTLYGSQANDLFNMFPTDVSNITDADPIEMFIPSARVAIGDFVVNFRKSLVVFTKGGEQFEMNNPDTLSPSTAALQPATSYQSLSSVAPIVLGAQLYFASAEAEYGQVFEYLFDDLRVTNTAFEITSHVPRLLPIDLKTIVASSNNLTLAVLAKDDSKYFVYRMFWSGSEKVQSAWMQWDFDAGSRVVDLGIIDNDIYSFVENANGVFILEKQTITVEDPIAGMPSTIHMDREQALTGVYNAGEDRTEFDIGFLDDSIDTVILGPAFGGAGTSLPTERLDSSTIAAASDISANPCLVGTTFEYRLVFSQPFITDEQGNPLLDGEVQLFALVTNHSRTGLYNVEIVSPGRTTRTHTLQEIVTVPELLTGTLTSQIQGNSKITTVSLTNISPYPSTISSAEWIADYIRRR